MNCCTRIILHFPLKLLPPDDNYIKDNIFKDITTNIGTLENISMIDANSHVNGNTMRSIVLYKHEEDNITLP